MNSASELVPLPGSDLPPHPFQSTLTTLEAALGTVGFQKRVEKVDNLLRRSVYVALGNPKRRKLGVLPAEEDRTRVWVPAWVRALAIIGLFRAYSDTRTNKAFDSAISVFNEGLLVLQSDQDAQQEMIALLALWRLGGRDKAWRRLRFLVKRAKKVWQQGH